MNTRQYFNTFVLQPERTKEEEDAVLREVIVFCRSLPKDKRPWAIVIDRLKRERTGKQQRALWGCAYKFIHDETGNDPETDLHPMFCGEFFGWEEYEVLGQKRKRPSRTTTKDELGHSDVITVERFVEFYDFVQKYTAVQTGLVVPDPDPDWKRHMQEEIEKEREAAREE